MPNLTAFQKPQKLIDRAKSALNQADATLKAWLNPDNLAHVHQVNRRTGENIKKVVIKNPLPDAIEGSITDAINNTRNAFDQAVFAACSAIGKPINDGHYPWADNGGRDLQWKFENLKTGEERIPSELWDVLRAQEPYPRREGESSGDTLLRTIATFANRKHTIGIEIGCSVSSISLSGPYIVSGTHEFWAGPCQFNSDKQEIELYRWRGAEPQFSDQPKVTFYVTFDASAPKILRDCSAIEAAFLFQEAAQRALDDLKNRSIQLGAT